MWQSATASALALALQQHLLFGGLGEAIAVIVGGVVSVIALRKAKRAAVRPAPAPRPAPTHPRDAAPPAYGEPAPPTTPDRRLHPGPISLSAPTPPPARHDGDDEQRGIATSLFNPEIFQEMLQRDDPVIAPSPSLQPSAPPVLRPLGQLSAEWRAQSSSSSPPDPASRLSSHRASTPIWNHAPFARPTSEVRLALDLAPEVSAAMAPPIWRTSITAEPTTLAALAEAAPAPIWASWLGSTLGASRATEAASATNMERLEAPGEADSTAADEAESAEQAPIWSSFLRRE